MPDGYLSIECGVCGHEADWDAFEIGWREFLCPSCGDRWRCVTGDEEAVHVERWQPAEEKWEVA